MSKPCLKQLTSTPTRRKRRIRLLDRFTLMTVCSFPIVVVIHDSLLMLLSLLQRDTLLTNHVPKETTCLCARTRLSSWGNLTLKSLSPSRNWQYRESQISGLSSQSSRRHRMSLRVWFDLTLSDGSTRLQPSMHLHSKRECVLAISAKAPTINDLVGYKPSHFPCFNGNSLRSPLDHVTQSISYSVDKLWEVSVSNQLSSVAHAYKPVANYTSYGGGIDQRSCFTHTFGSLLWCRGNSSVTTLHELVCDLVGNFFQSRTLHPLHVAPKTSQRLTSISEISTEVYGYVIILMLMQDGGLAEC